MFHTYVRSNGAWIAGADIPIPGDLPPFTRLRDVVVANGSQVGVLATNAVYLLNVTP